MTQSPRIEIGWGSVQQALAEGLEDLLIFHWQEVEQHQAMMPLDVDWPKYLMLERAGIYRPILLHKNGKLAGYAAYFFQAPLHHKHSIWAVNDVLYLDADARKSRLGPRLLDEAEDLLRVAGAKLITQDDRKLDDDLDTAKPRATLGDLLTRKGYKLAGRTYVKLL